MISGRWLIARVLLETAEDASNGIDAMPKCEQAFSSIVQSVWHPDNPLGSLTCADGVRAIWPGYLVTRRLRLSVDVARHCERRADAKALDIAII